MAELSLQLVFGAVVVLTWALAGCAGGSGSSRPGTTASTEKAPVKASAHGSTSSTRQAANRPSATSRKLPSVGEVIIQRGVYGTVIVDRATRGKRFSLSGVQAGECLSFLKANPNPSDADVRAACPGRRGPGK
jgi:hypothetical protein